MKCERALSCPIDKVCCDNRIDDVITIRRSPEYSKKEEINIDDKSFQFDDPSSGCYCSGGGELARSSCEQVYQKHRRWRHS